MLTSAIVVKGLAIVAGVTLLQYPGNAQTPNGRPGYEQVNDQLAGVEEPTPLGTPSADRDVIANEDRRFQLLSPSQTGIDFINSWQNAEKFPDGLAQRGLANPRGSDQAQDGPANLVGA